VRSKVLPAYAGAQVVLVGAFFFAPVEGWVHVLWQVAVGWLSAAVLATSVSRFRIRQGLAWYVVAAGLFLNAGGLLVDEILARRFNVTSSPNASDVCFLSLHAALIGALGWLAHRRGAQEDAGTLMRSTIMSAVFTIGVGLFAWESILWQPGDHGFSVLRRVVVTAYPLAHLVIVTFVLRLIFSGGIRSPAFALIVASIACFVGADVAWAVFLRNGLTPSAQARHLLEMTSMSGFAVMGAAGCHPSLAEVAAAAAPATRPRPARWAALVLCALTAPALLLVEALLDSIYRVSGQ
jgi:hypothetical protein